MKAELAHGFFFQRFLSFIIPFYGWRTWWSPFSLRGVTAGSSLFEFGWWHLAAQNIIFLGTILTLLSLSGNPDYLTGRTLLVQHSLFHFLSYCLAAAAFLMVYSFRLSHPEGAPLYSADVRQKLRDMLLRHGPLDDFDIMAGSTSPSGRTRFKRGWVLLWLICSHALGMYPLVTWYLRPRISTTIGSFLPARMFGTLDFLAHLCSGVNVSYVLLITFECLTLFYYSRVRLMARLNRELAEESQLSAAFLKQWLDSRSLLKSFDRARWIGIECIAFCALIFVGLAGLYLVHLEYQGQLHMTETNLRLMLGAFLCGLVLYAMSRVAELADLEARRIDRVLTQKRLDLALGNTPVPADVELRLRVLRSYLRMTDLHPTRIFALRVLQIVKHLLSLAGLYSAGRIATILFRVIVSPLMQRLNLQA